MNYKKFIPCIFLYKGIAVTSFEDYTPIAKNPEELAKYYSDNNADELLIFDLSSDDEDHDIAIGIIKLICQAVEIPVIGAGNVRRMEDVKKLLYAGCKKAALNFSKSENIAIIEEVSQKFGRDKIIVSFSKVQTLTEHKEFIEKYACEILSVDEQNFKQCLNICCVPLIAKLPDISLDKIMDFMAIKGIDGITGDIINRNAKEITAIKTICTERGISVKTLESARKWSEFKLNSEGLVPVIVQDYKTDEVLMMAYMNEAAYLATLKSGKMNYYSRSRNEQWLKGETSGHIQYVKSLAADCDMDTILAKVSQVGVACHTGAHSCFFRELVKTDYEEVNPLKVFEHVFDVIKDRKIHPKEGSYTNYLFDKGVDKILKKLGEEATEIVIAAKNPNADEIKYEISDFLYHMMVLMAEKGVSWEDITKELAQR